MLCLLREFPQREYPDDYLLARLRSRRALLLAEYLVEAEEGLPEGTTGKAIREKEQQERQWLFRQMNDGLRRATAPLFVYFEINTLVQCLRFIEAGRVGDINSLLDLSLLSGDLKNNLRDKTAVPDAIACVEGIFNDSPLILKGLGSKYREEGIQGCEEMFRVHFFQKTLRASIDPDMHSFFQDILHLSNTLTMAKCLRWKREATPPLLADASTVKTKALSVSEDNLRRLASRLLRKEGVAVAELLPVNLEPLLMTALLLKMSRRRRVAGEVVACIEYMLRIAVIARNRSIRLHAGQWDQRGRTDRETVH